MNIILQCKSQILVFLLPQEHQTHTGKEKKHSFKSCDDGFEIEK